MKTTKILIADDHPIVRHGIRNAIEAEIEFEVIAEANNGEEVIEKIQKYQPDILLLDLKMPQLGGLKVIPRVKKISPRTEIIVFTMYDDPPYIYESIRNGASGYLLKNISSEELIKALKAIREGKSYLQAEVTRSVLKKLVLEAKIEKDHAMLTGKEIEILQLAADGYINKQIAAKLYISEETVKTHLKNISQKLGTSASTHAVATALRQNIIE